MSEPAPLKPLNGWSAFFRGRFEAHQGGHAWTVDVDFLDFDQKVALYRDGEPVEVQTSPATFRIGPGATIEASMNVSGTLLGVAALAAAIERALRFKSNRWLG